MLTIGLKSGSLRERVQSPGATVKIEKFEDLDAWRKARELAKSVYAVTNEGAFHVISAFAIRYGAQQSP